LRNPAEGKSPAIGGGHLTRQGEEARAHEHRDAPEGYRPTIGVKGEPIDDGERDPDTIAEEQRRRSAEMEAKGVEAWKAEHDERTPEQKAEALKVAGAQPRIESHKAP
jgi:methylmalonyl-CoA mutase N-terminal domain/subunit